MTHNYADLPPHIIENILKLLPLNDIKNAVQTCKPWYNASCCPEIGRRIKINFDGDENCLDKSLTINRPVNRLVLTKINFSQWNNNDVFIRFAYPLCELFLFRCSFTLNELIKYLQYLPKLESLQIEMYFKTKFKITPCANLPNPLASLKKMYIKCYADQCAALNVLLSKCITLNYLSYNACYCASLFQNTFNAMAQWPSVDLCSLEIINSLPNDVTTFFECFHGLNVVTVKKFKLLISSEYDRDEFKKFCKKLSGLESFEIGTVNDLDLEHICEYLTNLRYLSIREFTGVTRQLRMIGKLNHLEFLDVMKIKVGRTGSHRLKLSTRDEIRKTIINL